MARKILIVEGVKEVALQVAAVLRQGGHATFLAESAADGLRQLEERRPDLLLIRAELPDRSGFSLCSDLKRRRAGPPVILLSSLPEASREHATASPHPADAYLPVPVPLQELRDAVDRLLDAGSPGRLAPPALPARRPPSLPPREVRDRLTEEDRAFVVRAFGSVAHRMRDLRERQDAPWDRPTPIERADSQEGRLQLLREEIRSRETQLARLSEVWEVRERHFARERELRLEWEVEREGLKMQLESANRKLAEALTLVSRKEKEYGESLNHLLLERFSHEKDLIEVVAAKERELGLLQRELARKDEALERLGEVEGRVVELQELLHLARERILVDAERMSVLEEELASSKADREKVEAALLDEIGALRKGEDFGASTVAKENTQPWTLGESKEREEDSDPPRVPRVEGGP